MILLRKINWTTVFANWKSRETSSESWVKLAKSKGWESWDQWRLHTTSQLQLELRKWQLYKFNDPYNQVPEMLIGPYQGWQKHFHEKNKHSFISAVQVAQFYNWASNHQGIKNISNNLPFTTEMIGLKKEDGTIVCIDGSHRGAAIALVNKKGVNINFTHTSVNIALAEISDHELVLLDKALKRGTAKK